MLLALGALVLDLPLVTVTLALGVLAWSLGLYESRNLWDVLLDPLVFAWALSTLLVRGWAVLARGTATASAGAIRPPTVSSR